MLVYFLELNFDDLIGAGLNHASDVAGFDGQLAPAAIDQDQQLNTRWTSLVEQGIQRGADGPAGVKHVVDQDDVLAGDREVDFRRVMDRLFGYGGKVVAI